MFSTIFDKATSYFDRRALVSSFFPSLVFWGLSVIAFITLQSDWKLALSSWDTLSGTLQFLEIFAFFVWVTFWSILTSNFRMASIRLFEGYWPDKKPFDMLLKWRRRYWQRKWGVLDIHKEELSVRSGVLATEQDKYNEREKNVSTHQSVVQEPTASDTQELDVFLSRLETMFPLSTSAASNPHPVEEVQKYLYEVRDWRKKLRPWIVQERQKQQTSFAERDTRLKASHKLLLHLYNRHNAELEKQRIDLNRELSLYYPPEPQDIMATRLGNVFRAIELYPLKRYHIDAVVIWPRLQPSLPDALSITLRDSITSLDSMVTLATFMLLFGIPLAIWEAVRATTFFPWWLALVLALIALSRRLYPLVGLSVLALLLSLVPTKPALFIMQLQTICVGLVIVLLLFWLSYQNAIQAALNYGERIKSAFDLHRWRVFEGLHLQLPPNLEEERRVWDAVCGLLDRDYSEKQVFSYAQHDQQFLPVPLTTVEMPVPVKDLPAYHVIKSEDITQERVSKTLIPVDALQKEDDFIGKCTLKALSALQPVCSAYVVDPQRLKNTSAVGIRASLAHVLGESLHVGDCIDVVLVPPKTLNTVLSRPVSFKNLLVMDVKRTERSSKTEQIDDDPSFVIVLAVPVSTKTAFLTMSTNGIILLSRDL